MHSCFLRQSARTSLIIRRKEKCRNVARLGEAGWGREELLAELAPLLELSHEEWARGAGGIAEGMPAALGDGPLPKFRTGGLLLAHAGGQAGMFSAVIPGWASGATGSVPVTVPVDEPQEGTR